MNCATTNPKPYHYYRMKIALVLIPFVAISAFIAAKVASRPSDPPPPSAESPGKYRGVAVTTTKVIRSEMEQTLSLTGVLRAERQINIGTKLPARALSVLVKEGDHVAPGQLLVQLDDRDFR